MITIEPMRWARRWRKRLRALVRKSAVERELAEEMAFHLEQETQKHVRAGVPPDEARRRAAVAFGGVERTKEEVRDARWLAWAPGLSLDLKLGLRMLAKSPGLTLVGLLGLAVAVGIATVSFGIIRSLVGTTVPLDEGDRVVVIQNVDPRRNDEGAGTLHDFAAWREALRAVEQLAAFRTVDRNIISPGARPYPQRVVEMTASGFRIARVPPLLGRSLHGDDERPGAPSVVVIGYDLWQDRFAGDSGIVGRAIQLGATVHTVVGVMPPGFAFPINNHVWTPLRLDPSRFERGDAPRVFVFGRLAPGATIGDAQTQIEAVGRRLAATYPQTHQHLRPRVLEYGTAFLDISSFAWALHLAQFLISLILVVIGTNVATLVYARTASRAGEIALRTALGASRARVVGQLFAEALVLSGVAAVIGLAGASVALWNIRAVLRRLAGEQLPYWMDFVPSAGMLLYVAGLAVLGAVIIGVVPALKATRGRVHANLQQLGPGGSGMRLGTTWTVLIVAQVAAAVAMLPVVLYIMVQQRAASVDGPTFATREWLTATLYLDREGATAASARDDAFTARYASLRAELVRRLEADPGVTDVVVTTAVPGDEPTVRMEAERGPGAAARDTAVASADGGHAVGVVRVESDFFRAFGIPIVAGRGFEGGDFAAPTPDDAPTGTAVIVNRSFVQKVLAGGHPLGRRVRQLWRAGERGTERIEKGPWYEIVGVVPDFPSPESTNNLKPKLYRPMLPTTTAGGARRTVVRRALASTEPTLGGVSGPVTLAVRVRAAAPTMFAGRMREVAVGVDPMLRLGAVRPLDEAMSLERVLDRAIFLAVAFVTLSVVLLSAAGIYALMSFTIVRRRREIGIRAALGAGPRQVLRSVLARAASQIALGIAIGLAMATALVGEMGRRDPRGIGVLIAVAAFMTVVGLAAALGPARRALRIQPTEALRAE